MQAEHPAVTEGAAITATPAAQETAHYADGTTFTGVPPLPEHSPTTGAPRTAVQSADLSASPPHTESLLAEPPHGTAAPAADAGPVVDPNRTASAVGDVPLTSLAKMAQVDEKSLVSDPTVAPADQTNVVVIDGHEAAKTDPSNVGASGMQLPSGGEVAGGNIRKTLDPPPTAPTSVNVPMTKERAALLSPIGMKLAAYIGRPPSEWGVMAAGDTIRGHMLLIDLNTGEKTRAMDGHKLNEGELYANLRNFPEALTTGDTIEQILGASH